jgi:alkanesulfonate monooxygenase SsuD/methylene tetrahydromethanopterin reductase-like flavin-dependent oxidoreductase (luciferase family)
MWADGRATFHGDYFHVENVILEPKPRPVPPIMIAGGGEQLTLRVVARLADSCNVVGTPEENAHKLAVLRRHCDEVGRNYDEIERTNIMGFLIARDEAQLKAKHERLGGRPPRFGGLFTVSQATDLIGRYRDVGIQLLIASAVENDMESFEFLASDIMPHFA